MNEIQHGDHHDLSDRHDLHDEGTMLFFAIVGSVFVLVLFPAVSLYKERLHLERTGLHKKVDDLEDIRSNSKPK